MSFSSGFEAAFESIRKQAIDEAHDQFAEELAATARSNGCRDADDIDIDLQVTGAGEYFPIDAEEIRRRANIILRGDQGRSAPRGIGEDL